MSTHDFSHEITLAPAFHDLDPMDVVWHGNYVKYLELARCEVLAKYGYNYPDMAASGYAWPIVDIRLKYVKPARFQQSLTIRASIVEWESRLKIDYVIRDTETGVTLTKAHTIQVAVDVKTGEMLYLCPPVLWQKLGVAP